MSESNWLDNWRKELLESEIPVVLEFWAEWCSPCKTMGPVLDEIEKEMTGKVKVLKANIETCPSLVVEYRVRSIPTTFIFKDGEVKERLLGGHNKESLVKIINKYVEEK
jgi:thioredoxin 1